MSWGIARRPIISNKLGGPSPREGSDGDTQIRQTNLGGKLFGKLGGRWYDIPLGIDGTTKFGTSLSNYLSIDSDSVDIIKSSKNVASFGSSMRVGEDSTSKSALRVASDGALTIGQKGAAANFSVAANGKVSISTEDITLTPSSGAIANGDSIIFIDADDSNTTKKDALADLATLFAGAGLTASSSVIAVDADQSGQITQVGTLTSLTGGTGDLNWDSGTLFVDSSENKVGIGETTPDAVLHIRADVSNSNSDILTLVNDVAAHASGGETVRMFFGLNRSGGDNTFHTPVFTYGRDNGQWTGTPGTVDSYLAMSVIESESTREVMRLRSSGNVGIGTATPVGGLELSAGDNVEFITRCTAETVDKKTGIRMMTGANGTTIASTNSVAGILADMTQVHSSTLKGELQFYTNSGDSFDQQMVIDSDGKVGIGEAAPDTKLEVLAGTANQLKLSFTNGTDTTFGTDTNGYLTITPSGSKILIADNDSIGSSSYVSGFAGNGWIVQDGTTVDATFDNLAVRGTMSVYELLIQQIRCTNGSVMISSAGKVEATSGLSASDDDGTITFEPVIANIGPFADNDIIMMQRVNPGAFVAPDAAGGATNVIKKLVYKITEVDPDDDGSDNKYTVANIGYNNTSSPAVGDDFVRIGNTDTASRQSVMYLTSDDTNAPFIDMKADIDSYADWHAEGSTKLRLGRLDGLTAGGTNEYGLWAGPSTTNYIKAGSGGLVLKGSEATYLSASANTLEFYDTNKKMEITGGNISMYADNGSTVTAQWDNTSLTLGGAVGATDDCVAMSAGGGVTVYDNSNDYALINADGLLIKSNNVTRLTAYDAGVTMYGDDANTSAAVSSAGLDIVEDSVNVANFGSTMRVGVNAADKTAFRVAADGTASIGTSGTKKITMSAAGVLTVTDILLSGKITITSAEDRNICIGTWSSGDPDAGDDNVSIGVDAGKLLEDGSQQNISIGSYAGDAVTTNDYNVAIGYNALTANNGTSNIGIGPAAGSTLQGGIGNLYIGMTAQSSGTSVNNEFAIGGWAAAGQGVTGKGSNTGTLGQASCTDIYMSEDSGADIHCKDLEYSGALNASDIRIKKNIKDFSLGLDFINKLRTVSFNFRAPSEWDEDLKIKEWWYQRDRPEPRTDVDMVRIGFIAQEVKESLGDVESNIHIINGDEADDKQSLDYTKFVIPLTKAVQELSAKIDTMQTEINNLQEG